MSKFGHLYLHVTWNKGHQIRHRTVSIEQFLREVSSQHHTWHLMLNSALSLFCNPSVSWMWSCRPHKGLWEFTTGRNGAESCLNPQGGSCAGGVALAWLGIVVSECGESGYVPSRTFPPMDFVPSKKCYISVFLKMKQIAIGIHLRLG